jgi:hypothetical protein
MGKQQVSNTLPENATRHVTTMVGRTYIMMAPRLQPQTQHLPVNIATTSTWRLV